MSKLRRDESGIALATVLIIGFIMVTLVSGTMAFAINSQDLSRHDQDWNAALAAAEAGLDDYLYRLNRINDYWQYTQAALPPPAVDVNPAFSGWTPVPGAANTAKMRYRVDNSTYKIDGNIKVAASGLVGNSTRTVFSTVRRHSFLDYLYFTEYETKDPAIYSTANGDPFDSTTAQSLCARHYYADPGFGGLRDPRCVVINFTSGDVIRGPLHVNDAMLVCGTPDFQGAVTTSWNNPPPGRLWRGNGSCTNNPRFVSPSPKVAPRLEIPPSNSEIRAQADQVLGGTGCLFTGPTTITLRNNGTMDVRSPYTRQSNCGLAATTVNKPLPANGVIYVQGVPASPSDPNYRAACTTHPLGYPIANDITPYGCSAGDVFLSGVLKGRLTIATANNIVVVNDTTYLDSTKDLLGLVADNYVEVYHPVRCTDTSGSPPRCTDGDDLSSATDDLVLKAALLTVKHSFRVQNYQFGNGQGTLNVTGAIGQEYRGIVGTGSGNTGYLKNYVYDSRLKYDSPPYFLDPVKSSWGAATWAEVEPCYPSATGAARAAYPCS